MKKNKLLIAIGAAVLIGIVSLLAYRTQNQSVSGDVIRIGAILPLTGQFASAGNAVRAGIELAVEKINNDNPNRIKLFFYDTKSESKNAAMGYSRLRSLSGVRVFFTTLSDHSFVLKPMIIKNNDMLFCIASHTEILKDSKECIFQLANTSKDEANCLCDIIAASNDIKRVYYYGLNTEAGMDFNRVFNERLNDKLIGSSYYEDDYTSIKNLVARNSDKKIDCVVVVGYAPAMGYLIKTAREYGYVGPIWANVGYNTTSVIQASGAFADTVSFVDYDFPYSSPIHKKYDQISNKKYGTSYSCLSYLAMGGCNIVNTYWNIGKGDTLKVKKLILKDAELVFDGIHFKTSPSGSITANLVLKTLKD